MYVYSYVYVFFFVSPELSGALWSRPTNFAFDRVEGAIDNVIRKQGNELDGSIKGNF